MLHTVKKVEYLEGYKLKLHFNDRMVKVVDLDTVIEKGKNMVIPLQNIEYFKKVKCDGFSISWPNGFDLCPDVLFKMGTNLVIRKRIKRSSTQKIKVRKKSRAKVS